ncbi:MFS transporter, DHA2 family, multidrug resistance protein [Maribacter dokdonensis]|uniref:MFS transporter, DHA2 family, multidrug resistance protein n=1 Tax=Maribacter dokdonensis TaxID=320912 RepID=A0ABY0UMS1_9FLAO|nr:DHA2 family efflux MFS transporter permease subunit [Maribacter dokdonensis]SDS91818.1 MFS transporter, DHA2 family, multidrug resistance protein [Maribacter dokdonensis]
MNTLATTKNKNGTINLGTPLFLAARKKGLILFGVTLCAALDILVATSSSVAIDEIAGFLSATADEIVWMNIGYFISKLIFLILSIQLTKIIGGKKLFLYSLIIFIIGAFLCGTTTSLGFFMVGRVFLGAGSAAFYTVAQAVLFTIFPINKQGTVQAIFSLAIVLGPNVIPAFSGWLTYHYIWQLIFLFTVIIGICAIPLINQIPKFVLSKSSENQSKINWLNVIWLSIGLGAFQFVMEEGSRYDWFEEQKITILSITALIGFVLFFIQNKRDHQNYKLIDFSVFRNSSFSLAFLISFVSGFALFGSGAVIPGFVQNILRYQSAAVGFTLFPSGIAILIGLITSAIIVDTKKIPPFASAALGVVCVITSMILVSDITVISGFPDMIPAMMLRGLGLGLLFVPIIFIAFNELKGNDLLTGTGLFNFGRQCGGSFAMAFLPTYLTHQMAFHRKNLLQHTNPYNTLFSERVQGTTQALISRGYNPIEAKNAALGTVDIALNVQSAVLAFQNTFFAISMVFLCAAPVIIATKFYLNKKDLKQFKIERL